MDPDSSTGGLNENSESGELDSLPGDDYHFNNNSRDSLSKQSVNSERTNIDALDDTARDTIIVPPLDDSSSSASASMKRLVTSSAMKMGAEHDVLDFGGDDDGMKEEGEEDDSDDGELAEESSDARSAGELSNHSTPGGDVDLEDGEVDDDVSKSREKNREKEPEPGEELEEGEVSDDDERKPKGPMPVCRFFGKGQCTWGSNCRFLHPGVIDKGLYTMFEKVRPAPPASAGPFPLPKPGLLGHAPPNFPVLPPMKLDAPPIIESPWERAQRHAKEVIKQSEKRKETDIDFEDKKMNLTLTQEEFDKENDYYVKKLTTPERDLPPPEEDLGIDEWDLPSRRPQPKIDPDFVRERVHHLKPGRVAPPRDSIREAPPLHEPELRTERNFRRTGVSRFHPAPDRSPPSRGSRRGDGYDDRGDRDRKPSDAWHDPWVRPRSRKQRKDSSISKRSSHSSDSSRSSSSSSRSSKSSKSSRSRSRSRSSKSGTGSPRRRKKSGEDVVRKAPPRRISPSPKPMRFAPPLPKDDFIDNRRGFGQSYNRPPRYAPPPPRESGVSKSRLSKPEPGVLVKERDMRKRPADWDSGSSRSRSRSWSPINRGDVPKSKRSKFSRERSRSKSSRKKSWSRSSSDSSESSRRSIPKGRPVEQARKVKGPNEKIAPAAKIKVEPSDDRKPNRATKPESSKSKIKMTIRPSSGIKPNRSILDKLADDVMGDEDEDESASGGGSPDHDDDSSSSKMKPSRREELLKQLQLVEEAIAKKRSKIS